MTRKPLIKVALTACIAVAMLAATTTTAAPGSRSRPGGHYDCSQDYEYKYKSRYFNAHMMRIFTYFDSYGTGLIDEAIRDLQDNAGADPGTLHTIASTAEMYLGYHAYDAKEYLHYFREDYIYCYLHRCPRLFGRNIAFNNSMCKRIRDRQAELRDQLNAALAAALGGGEG